MIEDKVVRHIEAAGSQRSFGTSMTAKAPYHGDGAGQHLTAESGELEELLGLFVAHHAAKLRLCDDLEAIADSLPERAGPRECLAAARTVNGILRGAHEFEEAQLWPVLLRLRCDDRELCDSLERLRYEHWEDESYAEEVAAVLTDWGMCVGNRNAEATGYLLRGFFEGLRRHVAFEREHLVPILRSALGSDR
ncbi:MAG: hypothetical protein BroJett030_13320 [Alphaproteobacteria bacterium]|nr:MAG: hypothetical protein BroJett030_13320 [Alphaproteobacteria bacterium]